MRKITDVHADVTIVVSGENEGAIQIFDVTKQRQLNASTFTNDSLILFFFFFLKC